MNSQGLVGEYSRAVANSHALLKIAGVDAAELEQLGKAAAKAAAVSSVIIQLETERATDNWRSARCRPFRLQMSSLVVKTPRLKNTCR